MGWPEVIKEALAWLRKTAPALFAFFAGRKSKARDIEKAENKVLEKELEHEREEDAILSDPVAVERMRERWKDSEQQ